MYQTYAVYYDQFYRSKDYEKEASFLHQLLSQHRAQTVLDVGCGTGTHLLQLEHYGYICEGIDFNAEMVEIAKAKLKGNVFQFGNYTLNKGSPLSKNLVILAKNE